MKKESIMTKAATKTAAVAANHVLTSQLSAPGPPLKLPRLIGKLLCMQINGWEQHLKYRGREGGQARSSGEVLDPRLAECATHL